ncbi:MAG: tetratricopeptide repeat protein [Candidatus Omnitrophica bacterium]|nr:tetratricopeptide repeat protein [Candidatus Omnitrophota bacterium]
MKQHVRAAITVILGMTVCGCGDQYINERLLWMADRAAKPVLAREASGPSYLTNRAVALYEKVIERDKQSRYALDARLKIGKLYLKAQEYERARRIYDDVVAVYPDNKEAQAVALFEKAVVYEEQGQWAQALIVFNEILQNYDQTLRSFTVPQYIAQYYVRQKDEPSAKKAYALAVDYYEKIIGKYPNSKAAMTAENFIIRIYMDLDKPAEAVARLEKIGQTYRLGPDALLVLAGLYQEKLHNTEKARQTYQTLVQSYPETPAARAAQKKLGNNEAGAGQ